MKKETYNLIFFTVASLGIAVYSIIAVLVVLHRYEVTVRDVFFLALLIFVHSEAIRRGIQ